LQKTASALGEGSAVEPSADEKQLPVPSALASPLLMRAQQQLEELRVQEVTAGPEASVIIAPENATRELKRRWLASSLLILVAGLWLTLCLGAVFDQWDCRPHFLEDVVRDIDLPLLAWLPKTRALKELQLPWPEELLAFGHRVRLLLAARGAMKEQMPVSAASLKEPQCLLVTSSKAGEGRSLVALSLAVASALEGQGVVLVVGDDSARLRLQQLSSSPGKASVQDFSDAGWCRVTAGKAVLADVLYSTSIEGLRILMVGKPSQPGTSQVVRGTDGVCGVAWDSVVSHLRALPENDLVIIDGPPVLSSVDALRLATLTEGTLFVLSVEDVERHQVLQAVNQLRAISAPMLGLIVNKMNPGVCRGKW
jgi:Mrp family chromosome partitioning ATPase